MMYIERKSGSPISKPPAAENVSVKAAIDYRTTFALCEIYFPHIMAKMNELLDARDALAESLASGCPAHEIDRKALNFEDIFQETKSKVAHQCRHPLKGITYVRIFDSPWN